MDLHHNPASYICGYKSYPPIYASMFRVVGSLHVIRLNCYTFPIFPPRFFVLSRCHVLVQYVTPIADGPYSSSAQQPNVGQGRLIAEASRSHTITHHSRYGCSGRGIGPSQRPVPDSTQHSQDRDPCSPAGFESAIPASKRPQTLTLNRSATGIGNRWICTKCICSVLFLGRSSSCGSCVSADCHRSRRSAQDSSISSLPQNHKSVPIP